MATTVRQRSKNAICVRIAQEIADRLFSNQTETAQRLVLTVDTPIYRNLGGWNKGAVINEIVRTLKVRL